jgi:hypothetical protein
MAREARGLAVTALVSFGAAAAVFAWLPATWPNPLPQGTVRAEGGVPKLRAAAVAVDAACVRGDLAAFAEATTTSHRDELQRRLATLDRALDADTLRALGADGAQVEWLDRPLLAGEVRGDRIVIAVARPGGDGAQVLAFVWDGRRLRFDGSYHAVGVLDATVAAARVAAGFATRR